MMNAVTVMREWVEITDMLSFEQKGRLFSAVFKYSLYEVEPKLEGRLKCFFLMMKPEIDKSNVRRKAQEKSRQKRHLQKDLQTDVQKGLQKDLQTDVQKDLQNGEKAESEAKIEAETDKKRVCKSGVKAESEAKSEGGQSGNWFSPLSSFPPVPPSITPAHSSQSRARASFADRLPKGIRTDAVMAKWLEWEEYRRMKRKPVTEKAAQMQMNVLAKLTPDEVIDAIDFSMANDYQALIPPKVRMPAVKKKSDKPI